MFMKFTSTAARAVITATHPLATGWQAPATADADAIQAELAQLGMLLPIQTRSDLLELPELDDYRVTREGTPFASERHYRCRSCGLLWAEDWGAGPDDQCPCCKRVNRPYKTTNLLTEGRFARLWMLLPDTAR